VGIFKSDLTPDDLGELADAVLERDRELRDASAEIEQLRVTERRYQYLKDNFTRCMSPDINGQHVWVGIGRTIGRGASVDEAIDAALSSGKGGV
jgi:hypothetical protein